MSHGKNKRSHHQRPSGALGNRPMVAIVGRPNVGKSALFNRLCESRIALVEDTPGVTRDRLYADAEASGREYILVDTGGFDPKSEDPLAQSIATQVRAALAETDVVVCVFDGSIDPLPADREAVQLLREAKRPVLYVANKVDRSGANYQSLELYALGIPHIYPVSAAHGLGIVALEDAIAEALPPQSESDSPPAEQGALRVAIAGRPNAGKSSLVNRLLGETRQIVDDRPGTTVDAVDSLLVWREQPYVLIDTAGIRRQRSVQRGVESLSVLQAIGAVERCDVVALLIDSEQGPAEQDTKIAGLAIDRGRALVVALNKTDLLDRDALRKAEQATQELLSFAPWVPIQRISALTGRGVRDLMDLVVKCSQSHQERVSTAEVNRFFEEVLEHHPPPTMGGKSVRLYYITQVDIRPPTFVIVANRPDAVHFSYRRYVINQLRERFGFKGAPVRVIYREKHRNEPERG